MYKVQNIPEICAHKFTMQQSESETKLFLDENNLKAVRSFNLDVDAEDSGYASLTITLYVKL